MKTWAERIIELETAGWSLTDIAKEVEASQQAMSELKQGRSKEPRGMTAVRLHELHQRICQKAA